MVEQSMSPSGQYDPEDLKSDRYDLISQELEQHIATHPDGDACLALLYELYDFRLGDSLFTESKPSENAIKSRKGVQQRMENAKAWYLSKASEVWKRRQCKSYTELSKALWWEVQDGDARHHIRSEERIRRYLNEATKSWYLDIARGLLKAEPQLNEQELTEMLMEKARKDDVVYQLSRKSSVFRYLRSARLEFWYLREAEKLLKEDENIGRHDLADRVMGKAVQEAPEYFCPQEWVFKYLKDAELGVS